MISSSKFQCQATRYLNNITDGSYLTKWAGMCLIEMCEFTKIVNGVNQYHFSDGSFISD